jgi:hypothetical protein
MVNPVNFPGLRIEPELGRTEGGLKRAVVGDLVQWTSNGVDQFETPRRVRGIKKHEGKEWAFVEGTKTGVPVSELTVVAPRVAPAAPPPPTTAPSDQIAAPPTDTEREFLRGVLSRDASYRLLVSGDIGPKELGRMIKLLETQKAILDDDADTEGRDAF